MILIRRISYLPSVGRSQGGEKCSNSFALTSCGYVEIYLLPRTLVRLCTGIDYA